MSNGARGPTLNGRSNAAVATRTQRNTRNHSPEPTLGLAPVACRQVFDLLGTLNAGGLAVLLAEQDVRASLALAQQAYVVENGSVALRGPAHALREDSRIKEAYLGL